MEPPEEPAGAARLLFSHSSQAFEWRRAAQEGMKNALTGAAFPDAMFKVENVRL